MVGLQVILVVACVVRLLEFAVPKCLDLVNLTFAEIKPLLLAGLLLTAVEVFNVIAILNFKVCSVRVSVIHLLLDDVAKLKSDLSDLTHVGARALAARGELKTRLSIKLDKNEFFKLVEVGLLEVVLHRLKDLNALRVGQRAEGVGLDHVQHSVNNFAAQKRSN